MKTEKEEKLQAIQNSANDDKKTELASEKTVEIVAADKSVATETKEDESAYKKIGKFASKQKSHIKSFFSDFKKFISKGSIIDLAIGLVIGTSFTAIVNSLVSNIIMPLLGSLLPTTTLKALTWKLTDTVSVNWGLFIVSIVNFFIIAFCIFLVLRLIMNTEKGLNRLKKRQLKRVKKNLKKGIVTNETVDALEVETAPVPAATSESELDILKDIRRLLMANVGLLTAEKSDDIKKVIESIK